MKTSRKGVRKNVVPLETKEATPQDAGPASGEAQWEDLLIACLPFIRRIVRFIGTRHRLSVSEIEELMSVVYLRLVDDDYAVLRKFQHRARLQTFLTVVIHRTYLDHRTSERGRWRPSAEARRQGTVAMELERLLQRDRLTFEEAVGSMESKLGVAPLRETLERLAVQLRPRTARREVGDASAATVADRSAPPDEIVARLELREHATRLCRLLTRLVSTLEPEERLMIELHFKEGLGIAEIARRMQVGQHRLYKKMKRLLDRLRRAILVDPRVASLVPELLRESWHDLGDLDSSSDG